MKQYLGDTGKTAVTTITLAAMLCAHLTLDAKILPFNEKKAPESTGDLEAIQNTLVANLPHTRSATVSISLGEGFGSGVIISPDGIILTAAHVTAGTDKELTVTLNDGTKLKAVSMGLNSNSDAAMMRITEQGQYPYVEINKDNNYKLGHWVFALGHSGGFEIERGPVVRLGRIVKDSETTLQTDCKVIGGDSGGPLFDLEGRLIGIHSRVSKTMEQNMHVPMREYLKHWDDLENSKFIGNGPFAKPPAKYKKGFLGIGLADTEDGLMIGKVVKGSPAEKAGLKAADIILQADDKKSPDNEALLAILEKKSAGDIITLNISRKGQQKTIKVKLGSR